MLVNLFETAVVQSCGATLRKSFGSTHGMNWGECPKNRFVRSPDGEPGLNYLCSGIRRFHHHAGPALRRLARQAT